MSLSSATLTVQKCGPNGANNITDLVAALAAANSGGDAYKCQGKEFLIVDNGDSGSHTITIKSIASNFGIVAAANDIVQAVAAGKIAVIGPIDPLKFADTNGLAQITWDAVTSVKVGLFSVSVLS